VQIKHNENTELVSTLSRRIIRHCRTTFRQELLTFGAMKGLQAIFGAHEISSARSGSL